MVQEVAYSRCDSRRHRRKKNLKTFSPSGKRICGNPLSGMSNVFLTDSRSPEK
jgi:hypothetical protein